MKHHSNKHPFCIRLILFYLLIVGSYTFAATIHLVGGHIQYENGATPNTITFCAYITSNPSDTMTQASAGSGYDSGVYWIQCGNFSTWSSGDVLHIDIDDEEGHLISSELVLTENSIDQLDFIIYFNHYSVTITTIPNGLDIWVDNVNHISPKTFNWKEGSEHTLNTDSIYLNGTDTRYRFTQWNHSLLRSHSISITASTIYTANFDTQFTLTTLNQPENGGVINISPGKAWYDQNDSIRLEAIADTVESYRFSHWSGDLSGDINPTYIIMNEPGTVTANYSIPKYTIQLTIDPPGSGSVSIYPLKQEYGYGETVYLFPDPAEGFEFSGWTGDTITDVNIALMMTRDWQITANFSTFNQNIPVTIITQPTGLPFYADGQVFSSPHTFSWPKQSSHQIRMDTLIYGSQVRYHFQGWQDTTIREIQYIVNAIDTLRANYNPQYQMTIQRNPELGGNVFMTPEKLWYDVGTFLEIQAEANTGAGYAFTNWSGEVYGFENPMVIEVDTIKNITANFAQGQASLTTHITPLGAGTIKRLPEQGSYTIGDTIYLIAYPDTAYRFDGWTGDISGANEIIMVVMDQSKTITAQFRLKSDTTRISFFDTYLPDEYHLSPNYPNPFNHGTTIGFSIPGKEFISLTIYNVKGQKINTLIHGVQNRGFHQINWDGTSQNEQTVESGIYFIVLSFNKTRLIQRALLIK